MVKRYIVTVLIFLLVFVSICYARSIPILMYHHIRELDPTMKGFWEKDLSCDPSLFRDHLEQIKKKGYTPITFKKLNSGESQRNQ